MRLETQTHNPVSLLLHFPSNRMITAIHSGVLLFFIVDFGLWWKAKSTIPTFRPLLSHSICFWLVRFGGCRFLDRSEIVRILAGAGAGGAD